MSQKRKSSKKKTTSSNIGKSEKQAKRVILGITIVLLILAASMTLFL